MARLPSLLLVLVGLAGCGTSAQSLGLTGAAQPAPPQPLDDNTISAPGIPQSTSPYGTSTAPSTGSGRYYGY